MEGMFTASCFYRNSCTFSFKSYLKKFSLETALIFSVSIVPEFQLENIELKKKRMREKS